MTDITQAYIVTRPYLAPQKQTYKSLITSHVDDLFRADPPIHGQQCENPITGGHFLGVDDPIAPQKRDAYRALLAREWFFQYGPPDAPVLPLSYGEREALKIGGLHTIVALFARSLESRDYDMKEHPTFFDYACGIMASEFNGYDVKRDAYLIKRFPPRNLAGLGPGLYWKPPNERRNDGKLSTQ